MPNKYWSGAVTKRSDALDLEPGVFTWDDPRRIAKSLMGSANASPRRKSPAYQSAMSMLNFYINRSGKNLSKKRLNTLNQARAELKKLK